MHGNTTAEAFITRQWLPDSPKNSCSLWHLEDIGRQTAVPMKIIRYWLLVNAARLAGSWSHRMHSATVARLHWPSRLPPKSLKISIRQRQAKKGSGLCRCVRDRTDARIGRVGGRSGAPGTRGRYQADIPRWEARHRWMNYHRRGWRLKPSWLDSLRLAGCLKRMPPYPKATLTARVNPVHHGCVIRFLEETEPGRFS
jgi:hypothetical protein